MATLELTPKNATHWSRAKMADCSGLSKSTIGRIWKAIDLTPHREDEFKLSNDPQFVKKVCDIVGLYVNPPEATVVYCVDETSQVQALANSQPAFPGMPEERTHDYVRHGTTSLFAAFNIAEVPDGLQVHLVCDNYSTHKSPTVITWLAAHPRIHMHFTPTYSSWINQVERLFAFITADLLQRSNHRSVQALENDIRNWVKAWNENPKPLIWTKPAEQILESLSRLLQRTTRAAH